MKAALIVCLGIALGLRVYQLGLAPFWMDEIATVFFIRLPWAELTGPIARLESNPPGYYALLKILAPLTGEGEFGLRLPAALAGAAAAVPVFLYARRAFGVPSGVIAAFCLALAGNHVIQSREARVYAVLFLLCATVLLLLDKLLEQPGRARPFGIALLLGVAGAAMLHLHVTAGFALAGLHVYALTLVLARGGAGRGAIVLALGGAAALTLLLSSWWLGIVLEIASAPVSSITWIDRPTLADFSVYFVTGLIGPFYDARFYPAVAVLGVLLACAAALAVRRRDPRAIALLAALATSAALFVLVSQIVPVLLARTALILLVFALPLFGWALATLRPRLLAGGLGLALAALNLVAIAEYYREEATQGRQHSPWRHAVEAVERAIAPDERAMLIGSFETLALPLYAGPRLRAVRPFLVTALEGDPLSDLVLQRMPDVVVFDPAGPCPEDGMRGWWIIRLGRPEYSAVAARLAACGWTMRSEQDFVRLSVAHWRAP